MKLLSIINKLFRSNVYPINVIDDREFVSGFSGKPLRIISYTFNTKDDVEYRVMVEINKKDRDGSINFFTHSKNIEHQSIIDLINTHDAIKVFNTLKSIIEKHKDELDTLQISSSPDRIEFYEKLLRYFHIKYEKKGNGNLIAIF